MKIIHTSPNKITEIDQFGTFDDCLFFSNNEYFMTQSNLAYVYSLELNEDKIINVSQLHDADVIADIAKTLNVDEDVAEKLLDNSESVFNLVEDDDYTDCGENGWWIQAKQGECAKKMGFEAVESEDEQGCVYIVPMLARENNLVLERVCNF